MARWPIPTGHGSRTVGRASRMILRIQVLDGGILLILGVLAGTQSVSSQPCSPAQGESQHSPASMLALSGLPPLPIGVLAVGTTGVRGGQRVHDTPQGWDYCAYFGCCR
jgi:hypothetical protein